MKKVNILGTEYTIEIVEPDEEMQKNDWVGLCVGYDKIIRLVNFSKMDSFKNSSETEIVNAMKETLRHEVVHAFFNESGLKDSANVYDGPWCKNEELVDWLAIQGPKIIQAWKEAGCID